MDMPRQPMNSDSAATESPAVRQVESSARWSYHVFALGKWAKKGILAVGGELKATICLFHGGEAALSSPLGNLAVPEDYRNYLAAITHLQQERGIKPEVIAHDLHPLYVSTRYARTCGLPAVAVQHHHAHLVSVMAEWRMEKPVVGICCDGVGYGTDGAAWGCEILKCSLADFERVGHLEYFPLIGGDAAAVDTRRPALALLQQAYGSSWREHLTPSFHQMASTELDFLERQAVMRVNCPMTSSLGRVFDGVSFLLGLCDRNEREAQAAIALDSAAQSGSVEAYPYATTADNGMIIMSMAPVVRAIVQDVCHGRPAGEISARFHETLARMLTAAAEIACERHSLGTVALSGGCFANKRLLGRVTERLEKRHLRVLSPRHVSCGDPGLALGQAVVAVAREE